MLDKKSIGDRLKAARTAKKMNKSKFAEDAGIDISQYGKAERGIEGLGADKLQKLASAHGINIGYIALGIGEILHSGVGAGRREDQGEASRAPFDSDISLLSKALADQAEANKIQASANEKYASGFAALAAILERVENKMALEETQGQIKLSLNKLLEGQGGGTAVLVEVLERDIQREAGGNKEKAQEIRGEIAHRIGPKLNADLKADIGSSAGS